MNKTDERLLRKVSTLNSIINELFDNIEKFYEDREFDKVEKAINFLDKVMIIKKRLI